MDMSYESSKLAELLAEFVKRESNYTHVQEFILNCNNTDAQEVWDSLTEAEQRAVADELYYHLRSTPATS